MTTRIILIRHGQTDWNLAGRYQGHTDIDLNSAGRMQAKKLSKRMCAEGIDAVYVSDRKRAVNFAKVVFGPRRIRRDPDLKEICFGVFEGLTYNEIMDRFPSLYSKWMKDPFGVRIPEAENPAAFRTRAIKAFKRIARIEKGRTVAIVSHGGVINAIISEVAGRKKGWDFIPSEASLNIVEFKKGKAKVVLLNDTVHLKNG